jgi:hypothetical protein
MSKPFAKPALAHSDQLALLKRRGMIVADDAMALHPVDWQRRDFWKTHPHQGV